MKTLVALLVAVFLSIPISALAEPEYKAEPEKEAPKVEPFFCPVSKISDNERCMYCHQMVLEKGKQKFGLKEITIENNYEQKPSSMSIFFDNGVLSAYYILDGISGADFLKTTRYLTRHPEIQKLIVEVHSGGGSVMEAWKVVGLMEEMRVRGVEVETRCYGIAASAGGIILVAGDIGSRFVSPNAEIMIHKVWNFSMFSVDDPDSAEDKADVLKHFQKNINAFFASRTKITIAELNSNTFHKMWWLTGSEAVDVGVADGLIQERSILAK